MICVLLCLAFFSMVFEVYPFCSMNRHFYGLIFLCLERPHLFIIQQLMDIWVVPSFWLLGIKLL